MKLRLTILILTAFVIGGIADQVPVIDLTPPPRDYVLTDDPRPDGFPVEIIDFEKCHAISILDYEVQSCSFTLKNLADTETTIKRLLPGCPCIALKDGRALTNVVLLPKGTRQVAFTIDAKKLALGDFSRSFLVEIEGQKPALFVVRGTVIPKLAFTPAKQLDLGAFVGDLPWQVTVQIQSLFDNDTISLDAPVSDHNDQLVTSLVRKSPKSWELTISPQLPMKQGTLRQSITLPVNGKKNYGPVSILITGQVKGFQLHLEDNNWHLHHHGIQPEQTIKLAAKIKFGAPPRPTFGGSAHSTKHLQLNIPGLLGIVNISELEEKQRPLESPETWRNIMSDLTVEGLPNGVTASMIPTFDGVKINLAITGNVLLDTKHTYKKLTFEVKYKGKVIDNIEIEW